MITSKFCYFLAVIANQNNDGQQAEIFELNFVHRNMLMDYHEKTLTWCKSTLKSLQIEEVKREIVSQPSRADLPDSSFMHAEIFQEWQQFNNSDVSEKIIQGFIVLLVIILLGNKP